MQGYFTYLPDLNYVSRSPDRNSNEEYIPVKNIFRRAKIRDDMMSVVTSFEDFTVVGDGRPEQVAQKIYGDPRFDWVVLISNNITKIRDQWPLTENDFRNFLLDKYGSDEELAKIHHYETKGFGDDHGRVVMPAGLKVDSNFNFNYLERNVVRQTTVSYGGIPLNELSTVDSSGTVKDANGNVIDSTDFISGWLQDESVFGRPSAPFILSDGSMLLSDDKANVIYRITYKK